MIVVDTNVIAYLMIPGERSGGAQAVLRRDPDWQAPVLWRSEFRNVLVQQVRHGDMDEEVVYALMEKATELMLGGEHEVASEEVIRMALTSGASAYDSEFVVLARDLGVPLVTGDAKLKKAAASSVLSIDEFVGKRKQSPRRIPSSRR